MGARRVRIDFGKRVPRWLRGLASKWAGRILPTDWTVWVDTATRAELEKKLGKGTNAMSSALPEYLDLAVWFASDQKNDSQAQRDFVHELRHGHYAAFVQLFRLAWDGRYKMRRKHALKLLDNLIETSIQRDTELFIRAWEEREKKRKQG